MSRSPQLRSISKADSFRCHSAARGANGWRGPIKSAPCTPLAAIVSAAENFQPGKIDCTISKPSATHAMHDSNAVSFHLCGWRSREPKHDLGLDARFGKRRQRRCFDNSNIVYAAVEYVAPDRRIYAILRPDRAIGETDLAPNDLRAASYICRTSGATR
jgi:hypothetical protein